MGPLKKAYGAVDGARSALTDLCMIAAQATFTQPASRGRADAVTSGLGRHDGSFAPGLQMFSDYENISRPRLPVAARVCIMVALSKLKEDGL